MGKSQNRSYSHGKLIAWIQNKCERCGRFIPKLRRRWCAKCFYIIHRNYTNKHRREKYQNDLNWRKNRLIDNHNRYREKHPTIIRRTKYA